MSSSSAIVAATRETAAKFPAKTALIAADQQISYADLVRERNPPQLT